MEKLLLAECTPANGHVSINKFYITCLHKKDVTLFIEKDLRCYYEDIAGANFFNESTESNFRIIRALKFLKTALYCRKYAKKHNIQSICFLSYDLLVLPIIAFLNKISGIKTYTFEHNTIPNSVPKKIIQSLCFKTVTRICYTPKAVEIYQKIFGKAIYIPHPILTELLETQNTEIPIEISQKKNHFKHIVFCPSGSTNLQQIYKKAKIYPEIFFIIKSNQNLALSNVINFPFFKSLEPFIKYSDFIYIPLENSFKVSGPFFTAIGLGKKVILQKGHFFDFAKDNFPNHIVSDEDPWQFEETKTEPLDITAYNQQIKDAIIKTLV